MRADAFWVRLDGRVPLTEAALHGPPTYETIADGGYGQCTIDLLRPPRHTPALLRPGTLLEVMAGLTPVYVGDIQDGPDGRSQIAANGLHKRAYTIPALDPLGVPTRQVGIALDQAVAAPWGWRVTDPGNAAAVALGTAPGDSAEPQSMGALLDQAAQAAGRRWEVNHESRLRAPVDPTTPTIRLNPDASALGTTSDGSATHALARYFDGTTHQTLVRTHPQWSAPEPARWETIPFTEDEWGTLSAPEVTALLDGAFARTQRGIGWASGVTVHSSQITTIGGTPLHPASVRAGRMAQIMATAGTGDWSTQAVIGRTRWTVGSDEIGLEPVGIQQRTLVDLLTARGRA